MSNATHYVLHMHEYGTSVYLVKFNGDGMPSEEQVEKACAIDFEPNKGEEIQIETIGVEDVHEIDAEPVAA